MSNVILKMTPKRIYPILRHDAQNAPIDLAHRRSAEYFGGAGFIAGRFPGTLTVDGQPAARVIECRTRDNRKLVATTWSNPIDGTYVFHNINADLEYDLIARDHNRVYSDVIIPAVKPWPYIPTFIVDIPDHVFLIEPETTLIGQLAGGTLPYSLENIMAPESTTIEIQDTQLVINVSGQDLHTATFDIVDASGKRLQKRITFSNPETPYRYYRIFINETYYQQDPVPLIAEVFLYDSDMVEIPYVSLISGAIWDEDSTYSPAAAFDRNVSTYWYPTAEPQEWWMGWELDQSTRLDSVSIQIWNNSTWGPRRAPYSFNIQGSYDMVSWIDIRQFPGNPPWSGSEIRNFKLEEE